MQAGIVGIFPPNLGLWALSRGLKVTICCPAQHYLLQTTWSTDTLPLPRLVGRVLSAWRQRIPSRPRLFSGTEVLPQQSRVGILISASKRSIRRFIITEKAPTRAFSVITNLRMDLYEALDFINIFTATSLQPPGYPPPHPRDGRDDKNRRTNLG